MTLLTRRELIACLSAMGLAPAPGWAQSNTPPGLKLGPARPFVFEGLRDRARKLAEKAYEAAEPPAKAIIEGVDFDKVQKIKFRPEDELWRGVAGTDPIAFFHLNKYSGDPVDIFALQNRPDGKQQARQVVYSSDYFDYS